MDNLIKFIIYHIDTMNGHRGTSLKLQSFLMREQKTSLSRIKNQLMIKMFKKYIILRIRYKISYSAFI